MSKEINLDLFKFIYEGSEQQKFYNCNFYFNKDNSKRCCPMKDKFLKMDFSFDGVKKEQEERTLPKEERTLPKEERTLPKEEVNEEEPRKEEVNEEEPRKEEEVDKESTKEEEPTKEHADMGLMFQKLFSNFTNGVNSNGGFEGLLNTLNKQVPENTTDKQEEVCVNQCEVQK